MSYFPADIAGLVNFNRKKYEKCTVETGEMLIATGEKAMFSLLK